MGITNGESLECFFQDGFKSRDVVVGTAEFAGPKPEVKYALLEVTKAQLAELEAGGRMLFHGHSVGFSNASGEEAALSSSTATFGLEFFENSNTVFVADVNKPAPEPEATVVGAESTTDPPTAATPAPEAVPDSNAEKPVDDANVVPKSSPAPAKSIASIFAQVRGHIILKPHNADKQRIRQLVSEHALSLDPEGQSSEQREPLTAHSIEHAAAVSSGELQTILAAGPYVEVNGAWRYLPGSVEREIADVALTVVSARGLSLDALDANDLFNEVQLHFGPAGKLGMPSVAVLRKALRSVEADPPKPPEAKEADKNAGEADKAAAGAEKPGDAKGAEAPPTAATEPVAPTPAEEPAEVNPNHLKLDGEKVKKFKALQLLRESPTIVRERFDLEAPPPLPKRARVGGSGLSSSSRDPPLRLEEFAEALRSHIGLSVGGDEAAGEAAGAEGAAAADATAAPSPEALEKELDKICGSSYHVDLLEGTVHILDAALLPHEPRERLKRLLELQSHWRPERLVELLEPVLGKGIKVLPWLMKNTRPAFIEVGKAGEETRCLVKKFPGLG